MSNVAANAAEHSASQPDFPEVVRTAEVVFRGQRHRIEVLKGFINPGISYWTRSYKEEAINDKKVWVHNVHAPWTSCDDAESALWRALGFLSGR